MRYIDMSEQQLKDSLESLKARLERKRERELAYLLRRRRAGMRTPTDEAYEADQQLEAELLQLFDELLGEIRV